MFDRRVYSVALSDIPFWSVVFSYAQLYLVIFVIKKKIYSIRGSGVCCFVLLCLATVWLFSGVGSEHAGWD